MGQIYLKFKVDKGKSPDDKPKTWLTNTFEEFAVKVLTKIIPKANPDFDDKIDDVNEWLLEFDEETETPEREIGINNRGQTIMIMPFGRNYGYWTDNNLKLKDFIETFNVTPVVDKEFNDRWNQFENGKGD